VQLYAASGHPELALAFIQAGADTDRARRALPMLALVTAVGDVQGQRTWRRIGLEVAGTPEGATLDAALGRAAFDAVLGDAAELAGTRALLERIVPDEKSANGATARALLEEAAGDRHRAQALKASPFPQVRALGEALEREAQADWAGAVPAGLRAIEGDGAGHFLVAEWYFVARARRAAGDAAGTASACDEVMRPRLFNWAWGAGVGTCLAWTAEAQEALGLKDAARATWGRLQAMRSRADTSDPLGRVAREHLGGQRAER
jgi:hypothetical protein